MGGLEGLAQWLKDRPKAHGLLMMPQPAFCVAIALADGSTQLETFVATVEGWAAVSKITKFKWLGPNVNDSPPCVFAG